MRKTGHPYRVTRISRKSNFASLRWVIAIAMVVLFALGSLFALSSGPVATLPASSTQTPSSSDVAAVVILSATPEETAPLTPVYAIPLPTPAWQPSAVPSDADLEATVARMSLEDKIGQMLIVSFEGQSLANSPELATMVGAYHVGGVLLLEANAHDPPQLSALTAELQSLATSTGAGIPLFISINHEGGTVVRITEGVTGFPGNMAVAATGQPEYAYISAALAARELRAMGINMNLAPVLDVNDNPMNPVIGTRSFGEDPPLVAEYGRLAVRGTQANGVIAVAKHFPGHGHVAVDSHEQLPVLEASLDELVNRDLLPFAAAIEEGVAAIMTAHIAVPALDGSGRPATLSPPILTGLLRQQMGYDGLILTDSLNMGAVADRGPAQSAVGAVQAGADVVLSVGPMPAQIAILEALVAAAQRGEIPVEQIDRSVLRILRVKHAFDLFVRPSTSDLGEVGSSEHQAIADEIALRAVTLLRNDSASIPLPSPPARLLLISPDHLPSAGSGDGTLFAELLRGRGYEVTELVVNLDSFEGREAVRANALAQVSAHNVVIFGEWELIKRYVNWGDAWQEELIEALGESGSRLIVVAWYNPAAILRSSPLSTFLTAYGNTRAQVAAVVAVLTGERIPTGHLPMTIPQMVPDP